MKSFIAVSVLLYFVSFSVTPSTPDIMSFYFEPFTEVSITESGIKGHVSESLMSIYTAPEESFGSEIVDIASEIDVDSADEAEKLRVFGVDVISN